MKTFLSLIFFFFGLTLSSQNKRTKTSDKKYFIWVSPSKVTHVYGLMFNFWPKNNDDSLVQYPKINGIEINSSPVGIFAPFLATLYSLDIPKIMSSIEWEADSIDYKRCKKVNGLELALCNLEPTIVNGFELNLSGNFDSVTNGLTISIPANRHAKINGVTISIIANADKVCNGVQIGLFNACAKLKGMQFGLWNKNQKRSLPFINWCFDKRMK